MKRKGFFLSIIIFLIVFLPLTIMSLYYKITEEPEIENKNHLFQFNNKLYFYNNNHLINKYECETTTCDYAEFTIDDINYDIDFYAGEITKSTLINNRYAFINDNLIKLYDVTTNKVLATYKSIKNYAIGIENNLYIVTSINDKVGVISLKNEFKTVIDFNYDFIGLNNNIANNQIVADYFVVASDSNWYVLDSKGDKISTNFDRTIYLSNGKFIQIKNNEYYEIYDFTGKKIEDKNKFIQINFYLKYLEFITDKNVLYYYDYQTNKVLTDYIKLNNPKFSGTLYPPYETKIEDNKLNIKVYTDQTYGTTKDYYFDLNN